MGTEILVALITGGLTLIGVLISNNKHTAVIETKLEALTEHVEKHNKVIERVYNLETKVAVLEEKVGE